MFSLEKVFSGPWVNLSRKTSYLHGFHPNQSQRGKSHENPGETLRVSNKGDLGVRCLITGELFKYTKKKDFRTS